MSPDPSLAARILSRRPLRYTGGADLALDRPAHIRGGSSLAWIADRIVLVQDDANFLAMVDPSTGEAHPVSLPAGKGGARQFDDLRGNKRHRLDLEACVAIAAGKGTMLLAFGSGSSRRRERVLVGEGLESPTPGMTLVKAPAFYAGLRRATDFSGSQLNLEGAIQVGSRLRLFSRGNGSPMEALLPVNATCDISLGRLLSHLRDPERTPPPRPAAVVRYGLGTLDGIPLGFTDAIPWHGTVLYSAAAEASPDAVRDGPVAGSAIGLLRPDGTVRWAPLTGSSGEVLRVKAEGLVADPASARRLLVVLDADDPSASSELCTVELDGPWS